MKKAVFWLALALILTILFFNFAPMLALKILAITQMLKNQIKIIMRSLFTNVPGAKWLEYL